LFRILLGFMLLRDWFGRLPYLRDFYTEDGVLPLSAHLPATSGLYHFSLFDHLQSLPSVQFAFFVGLVGYLGILLGYKTRVSLIVSFVFLTSMLNRNPLILSNSHLVLVTMLLWTLFLPMGKRFALDCIKNKNNSNEAKEQSKPTETGLESEQQTDQRPAQRTAPSHRSMDAEILSKPSPAAFAIVLQIALIYFWSAVVKYGESWQDGTAVFLSLQLDQFVTPLGHTVAQLPLGWLSIMTFATLTLEWSAPLLILSPFAQPLLRRLAILALTSMHMGIMLTMNVGDFSPIMVATYALLLRPEDWRDLKSLKALKALSSLSSLNYLSSKAIEQPSEPKSKEQESEPKVTKELSEPRSQKTTGTAITTLITTSVALAVGSAIWISAYNINVAPRYGWAKITMAPWQKCLLRVAHISQDWHIFAPNPPIKDGWMVVDCYREDKTHIDPLTGLAPTMAKPDNLQAHLPLPWRKYHNRLKRKTHRKYRQYYCRYLMAKVAASSNNSSAKSNSTSRNNTSSNNGAVSMDSTGGTVSPTKPPTNNRPIGIRLYYCQETTKPPGMEQNPPIQPISIWYTPKEMKKIKIFGKTKGHRRVYF